MAKINTVSYRAGYKITKDYQGMEGSIEATATVDEGETAEDALHEVRAAVRQFLSEDHERAKKTLQMLAEQARMK